MHALAELGADLHAKTETAERAPNGNQLFYASPPTGFTALLFAVRGGHIDAVQVLLAAGVGVNDTLSDGQNALVVAVANANWELADYLLDRGADPNLAGAGWNAVHQLLRTRRMNTGFGFPGPIPSGSVDSIDVLKKMVALGGDVDARMTVNGMKDGQRNRLNRLGATPFFLAAKVTDTEAMQVLMDAGADATTPSADGTTPLMVAAGVAIWNPGEDGGSLPGQEDEVLEAVKMCVELGNEHQRRQLPGDDGPARGRLPRREQRGRVPRRAGRRPGRAHRPRLLAARHRRRVQLLGFLQGAEAHSWRCSARSWRSAASRPTARATSSPAPSASTACRPAATKSRIGLRGRRSWKPSSGRSSGRRGRQHARCARVRASLG